MKRIMNLGLALLLGIGTVVFTADAASARGFGFYDRYVAPTLGTPYMGGYGYGPYYGGYGYGYGNPYYGYNTSYYGYNNYYDPYYGSNYGYGRGGRVLRNIGNLLFNWF